MPQVRHRATGSPGASPDNLCEPEDAPTSPEPSAVIEPKPTVVPPTSSDLAPIWSKVIRAEGVSPLLRAVLTNSSLATLSEGKANIICHPRYAADAKKRWIVQITEVVGRIVGSPVEISITSPDGEEAIAPSAVAAPTSDPGTPLPTSTPTPISSTPRPSPSSFNAAEHPLVKQALELFGGRIVEVQTRKPN